MAFLYQIKSDGSKVEPWTIDQRPAVVGRGDSADVFIEDDSLSRSHFLIVREAGEFLLVDLHSRNGTWVKGERISACKLRSNEVIKAGESLFYFSLTQAPVDLLTRLVPLPVVIAEANRPQVGAA